MRKLRNCGSGDAPPCSALELTFGGFGAPQWLTAPCPVRKLHKIAIATGLHLHNADRLICDTWQESHPIPDLERVEARGRFTSSRPIARAL